MTWHISKVIDDVGTEYSATTIADMLQVGELKVLLIKDRWRLMQKDKQGKHGIEFKIYKKLYSTQKQCSLILPKADPACLVIDTCFGIEVAA